MPVVLIVIFSFAGVFGSDSHVDKPPKMASSPLVHVVGESQLVVVVSQFPDPILAFQVFVAAFDVSEEAMKAAMEVERMRSDLLGFIEVESWEWVERGETGCFVEFRGGC